MSRNIFAKLTLALVAASLGGRNLAAQAAPAPNDGEAATDSARKAHFVRAYDDLPLRFEANQGQADNRVKFLSRDLGRDMFLTPAEAVLVLRKMDRSKPPSLGRPDLSSWEPGPILRMKLEGANLEATASGLDPLPSTSNYFVGNNPTTWRTDIPSYSTVRFNGVYPGIDLVYYGKRRELEYDFVIAPGADPNKIKIGIRGAGLRLDDEGNAVLHCDGQEIRLLRPVVYQEVSGNRKAIKAGYVLRGRNLRIAVGPYDRSKALTIDPVLTYSTYLGGSLADSSSAIAVDAAGNVYVTGFTASTDFPTNSAYQPTFSGTFYNVFVTKFNAAGNALVYSTYLGGTGSVSDQGTGIAVDASGNAYITGITAAKDFPIFPKSGSSLPVQSTFGGGAYDAFVTELNPTGNSLVYSTYLGGSGYDYGTSIVVDSSSNAYVTGYTASTNFPTAFAFQSANASTAGGYNAFVSKLNPTGSALLYSTYLGGNSSDGGTGIALDSSGNAYVAGSTSSTNFPVTPGALQTSNGGGGNADAFVAKLNSAGSALVYSTYLGGSGVDAADGLAVDASGNVYLTGTTNSTNFSTTPGAVQTTFGGGTYNVFVSKLNAAGTGLVYSTYLGGSGDDEAHGIAVDPSGNAYVTGFTSSTNFPLSKAIQSVYGGGSYDAFVTELAPTGATLLYSTYLGGSGDDEAHGIAVDPSGNAYISGYTNSTNFPVINAFQATNKTVSGSNVNYTGFVAKIAANSTGSTGTTPTSTAVTSSSSSSVYGQSVTYTATVTTTSTGSPTGNVWFFDGTASLGSTVLTSGQASFSIAFLTAGSHSITAVYNGDSTLAPSTSAAISQTVSQAGTVTTLSSSPTVSAFGQSITLTAIETSSSGAGTPTGTVAFNSGQTSLGTATLSAGSATLTTASLPAGSDSITAVYSGDANFTGSTSATIGELVLAAPSGSATPVIPVGNGPIALALNPATNLLYVANQTSNSVSVINLATLAVIDTIPVGTAPRAIGINQTTNRIYVADSGSADVAVIDGSTNTLSTTVSIPGSVPQAITVNAQTNQIFVGSASNMVLALIDGVTNSVSYPDTTLSFGPIAADANPVSNRVYVASYRDSNVQTYLTDFLLSTFTSHPGWPTAVTASPLGKIYVVDGVNPAITTAQTGALEVLDESSTSVTSVLVGLNPYSVAADPAANVVYVANQSAAAGTNATVTAVDATTNSIITTYLVGQTPVPANLPTPNKMAVDSANQLVYVANEVSDTVSVIYTNPQVTASVVSVPVGTTPSAVVLGPLCRAYVANFGSGTVSVVAPSGNGPAICLSASFLAFGPQIIGTTSPSQSVTLTNIGNATLTIQAVAVTGDFSLGGTCTPGGTAIQVTPSQTCTLQATFAPTVVGIRTGQIAISSNLLNSPTLVSLSGDGVTASTTELTVTPNPSVYGQALTLTATVSSANPGAPTGFVGFYLNGALLKKVLLVNGSAAYNPTFQTTLPVGSQQNFTAGYSGDLTNAPSISSPVSLVVNKASTQFGVFLSSSITSNVGDSVTFESAVQVVPPGSGNATEPAGQVTFYDGQSAGITVLGSVTILNGVASFSTSSLSAGSHSITATYPGDSNLLGSTSPVLTQVVNAVSGGSGGTGGGTPGSCGCAISGEYIDPGAPVDVATTSPHNKYVVTPGSGYITVAVPSGANPLNIQLVGAGFSWGFSPDDDRFVFHFLSSVQGQPNTQIDNIQVFDLTATPPRMIVNTQGVVGAQTSLSFSPSGRYFLVGQVIGQNAAEYQVFQVQGVTAQELVFDSGLYNFAAGSGSDFQTVAAGFSPDKPESAFVYAYLDATAPNPNTFIWNLVSLSTGKALSATIISTGNGSFWKFNPCGDIVALATQTSQSQMNIDLYSTTFVGPSAAHLKSISGAPLGTVAFANLGLQEVQYPDQTTAIITSDPSCSPNTPTGSNVVVSIGSAIAGANQISVKFGNVTQAGFTAIAPLSPTNGTCPPAPGGFQLAGTPPICFDLSTTAIYDKTLTPAITVCVTLNGATSSLTFGHFENGTYMNRTVSVPNQPSNEICAGVQSLSPFAIFQRVPVPLTIKANPTSRQYGTGDPAFTVSYSGFVNGEDASILSGQLSCKSNSTLLSPVGSYTIDCSTSTLSSPNYIVTYAPGVLTVTPAPLTITASNRSKTYGQTVTFAGTEFTASGLVNADKMTSVTLASAGAAASASVAGSPYPITPSSAVGTGLSNYSITYNTAALTIVPASQTITLTGVPASALFGQGPFTLNASATSGLAVTLSASGNCLLSSNTLSLTGIGTCTVTASQPGNGNDNPAPTLSPSFAIGPAVTATNVSTSPATVQYSDYTTLTATISPVTVSVQALTGNVQFYLNGSTVGSSVPINSSGVATLSQLQVNLASASYPVKAVFSNTNANFAGSTGTTTQTVAQENAFILYSGDTIAQVGTTLNLRATVWDSAAAGYPGVNPETGANATIGDITKMWIAFDIYPAGSCGSGAPSTLYAQVGLTSTAGVGIAASTLSSTTEVSYCVVSRLVAGSAGGPNQFYTAPAAETAGVDFYVNSGQFATGGGWVNDPSGSHGNFGFNARYNSTGSPKGQMVYIYRALYNGVPADFIIKSNALSALQFTGTTYPISSTLQGKANVQVNRASDGYSLFSAGNYTFSATVTDSGQNGTGGKQFSLIVYDSSGAPYHSVPAGTPLQGGNVVVHSK